MKITAAVVREKGKPFQFEELDLQDPREGEVMVKIAASGVCHTDEVAQHQMIPVPLPAVLGHEGCGIVAVSYTHLAKDIAQNKMGVEFIDVDVDAFKQKVLPLHETMLKDNPKIVDLYNHIQEINEKAKGGKQDGDNA